jgi:hypothetical protein
VCDVLKIFFQKNLVFSGNYGKASRESCTRDLVLFVAEAYQARAIATKPGRRFVALFFCRAVEQSETALDGAYQMGKTICQGGVLLLCFLFKAFLIKRLRI